MPLFEVASPVEKAAVWNWTQYSAVCRFSRCWAPQGSGVCSSVFSASALLTRRAGAPLSWAVLHITACSAVSLVSTSRCHCGNHTFLNGPGEHRSQSYCIFSEHRPNLYPHSAPSGQLGLAGCVQTQDGPVTVFRDVEQEAPEGSQSGPAGQQCCLDLGSS